MTDFEDTEEVAEGPPPGPRKPGYVGGFVE